MQEIPLAGEPAARKLWQRALLMLLLGAAFQLACSLLLCLAVVQLLLAALTGASNARLRTFGATLGAYLAQIAAFEAFRSEQLPFPFAEWPQDAA